MNSKTNVNEDSTHRDFDPDTAPDLSKDGWPEKFAALQVAITQGIESGQTGELDMESVKQKARQLAGTKIPDTPDT